MKDRLTKWHLGYIVGMILFVISMVADLPAWVNMILHTLIGVVFAVSIVQIYHKKMCKEDDNYRYNERDERTISIRDKAGSTANLVTMCLLVPATILFIELNYILPAVITGVVCLIIQPLIFISAHNYWERKM